MAKSGHKVGMTGKPTNWYSRLHLSFLLGGILLLAVVAAGCGDNRKTSATKKDASGTNVATASASTATTTTPGTEKITAPPVYSDPVRQKEFADLFEKAQKSFAAPIPGMLIRVEKKDGTVIIGELIRFTRSGLVINTSEFPVTVEQADITPDSQAAIFPGAFAEQMAKSQIEKTQSGFAGSSGMSMVPPSQSEAGESRQVIAERAVPRAGPGRHYATVDENVIYRGTEIRVLDEVKGWICIKENGESALPLGWIPKHSSAIPLKDANKERVAQEIESMQQSGFLVSIDPMMNEALVDSYEWRISDSATVEGKGRVLARHCGLQKNIRVYFVVIKDAQSGRKLAQYSESRGFKVF
jgi:small nuclear ribonucleoprotein (snRNP)-like protein